MHGDVILARDATEQSLRSGDVGTVVDGHVVPGVPAEQRRDHSGLTARQRATRARFSSCVKSGGDFHQPC